MARERCHQRTSRHGHPLLVGWIGPLPESGSSSGLSTASVTPSRTCASFRPSAGAPATSRWRSRPELRDLARHFAGADDVITWGDDAPTIPPIYDLQIEITELPYLLRCGTEDLSTSAPYLQLPHDLPPLPTLAAALPRTIPRVGLAWSSSQWDTSRSIPFHLLDQLLPTINAEFWSLQTAADNVAWHALSCDRGWPARAAAEGSALETARALTGLDLVLSVDTFVAHLAGALGKPVWLLLKHDADWRWGIDRPDSPWYPTMRLFRQPQPGDWLPVLAEVRQSLDRWSTHLE